MPDNQFTDLPPGATVVQPGAFTDLPPGATVTQQPQAGQPIDLRRPQPSAPTGPGFTVDVLGRQYMVDAPTQEAADRAAASVAERVGAMQQPDPNVPQVPNEGVTWDQEIGARIIDNLSRELWTQERADRPLVSKIGDWTRDLLEGVTLGGAGELVAGIDQLIPGGMNYNERLAFEDNAMAAHRAENPTGGMVAEIAGGLPWLATPGALPSRTRSFGSNVARSTGNAVAIGGAYGALGTEGGLEERMEGAGQGAALGAGIGAGIPALGRLVSPAVNLARAGLPNADRTLVRALQESGTTGPAAANMLRRNPDLTLADIDPNAQSLAQGIAAQPGEGRQIINNAVNLRQQNAPGRVADIFDREMGPTPDVYNTLEGMRTTAQTNAQRGFGQALGGAAPVDLSRAVQAIEAQLFPGGVRPQNWRPLTAGDAELASILNRITQGGTGLVTDPQALHTIQSELRETASALGRSATGSERRTAGVINRVRQDIVDAIDEAAGGPPAGTGATGAAAGPYRAAQSQYATDMQVREAFDRGFEVLQNPTAGDAAIEARPEFWREWVNGLTPAELDAARLGARAAVDTTVGSARNAAARGIAVPDVEFNFERLALLFGRDEADNIAAELADARLISQTNQRLVGGSQTEMRRQGVEATAVRPVFDTGSTAATGMLGMGAAFAAGNGQLLPAIALGAAGAANAGRRYLGNLMDQSRNAELARVLMASGPDAQARLGNLVGPLSLRALMTPNRLAELGLAPARTAVPATTNY
jgi:hypothetical protein